MLAAIYSLLFLLLRKHLDATKDIKGLKSTYNLSSGGKIAATKAAIHCVHFLPIFKALEPEEQTLLTHWNDWQSEMHYWAVEWKMLSLWKTYTAKQLELQPSTGRQKHVKGYVV